MLIRKLGKAERNLLLAHLLRLDPASRRLRFSGTVSDENITAYVARLDEADCSTIGAFDEDGVLRGVCETIRFKDGAEIALSVENKLQGAGIGQKMLSETLRRAAARGIKKVHLTAMAENGRLRRLAAAFPSSVRMEDGGVEIDMETGTPEFRDIISELTDDAVGNWTLAIDVTRRLMEIPTENAMRLVKETADAVRALPGTPFIPFLSGIPSETKTGIETGRG
jgi:GNAT superfamily N-acetyltransferase